MTDATGDPGPLGLRAWFGPTLVLCFASIVLLDVPMPLSRSGSLELSLADFVAAALWAWVLVTVVRRRWTPRSTYRLLLLTVAAFLAWFVVIEVIRQLRGQEVLQSLLILRTTVLPLAAYLILGPRIETPQRALNAVVVFEASLTIWHLATEWHNMRMSDFLGNSIVYAGLLVMLLPANVFVASRRRGRAPAVVEALCYLNMLAALVLPVWAGSRGLTLVAFVGILACFLIMFGDRRLVMRLTALGVCAVLIELLVWFFNPSGAAYGIYRLVPTPSRVFPGLIDANRAGLDEAQRDTALSETGKSDAGRAELANASLEHIKADPIVGDGIVYFELPDDGVTQQYAAHNFVLEHANAYGGVGLVGYLAIYVVMLVPALGWLVRRRAAGRGAPRDPDDTRHAPMLAVLTVVMLAAFSLTQPTSLIMAVMVPFCAAIGGLLAPLIRGEPSDVEPVAVEPRTVKPGTVPQENA